MNIIQNKLNQKLNKDFQQTINKFLKNVDRLKQEGPDEGET